MNRSPSALRSTPPSPRTPSVTRMPRTDGGHTIPVGWNWTNSMSMRSAPAQGQGVAVTGVLPGVRCHLVGLADPTRGQNDRRSTEHDEAARLPPVAEGARDAVPIREQPRDRALHEHLDPRLDRPVLEGADHLEPRPVAHVGQPGIAVTAEVALEDAAVRGAVEQGAP